jgi:hypothetical protein|nr:MAG TPA: hypothetical protein [Bacteriophage sp.]
MFSFLVEVKKCIIKSTPNGMLFSISVYCSISAINALNGNTGKCIFSGVKNKGTLYYPIEDYSFMLVVLQTSTISNTPVYIVSRYHTDICIQLLAGGRDDTKASIENEKLVVTLGFSTYVSIYSF